MEMDAHLFALLNLVGVALMEILGIKIYVGSISHSLLITI